MTSGSSDSDRNLTKRAAGHLADASVDIFVATTTPWLLPAWALVKALYGNALELRQKRAIEFIELIRDNPTVFNKQLLQSEDFQDAFAWSFEKYLIQRLQYKRIIMQQVFLGFAKANKPEFPIERIYTVIENLTFLDVAVFKMALTKATQNPDKSFQVRGNTKKRLTEISTLIYQGLLIEERMARMDSVWSPYVTISEFGHQFAQFITKESPKI